MSDPWLGSALLSKWGFELAAAAGAFMSLAYRKLSPIASFFAFLGGFIVAKIFGPAVLAYLNLPDDWVMPAGFLLGSLGWSGFGALMMLAQRFHDDPLQIAKSIKELWK